MEKYVYNANAAKHYENILSGGAPPLDRYVFNAQDGDGIGSFFAPIMKAVIPIVKTVGASLFRAIKPAAKSLGREAIKGVAAYGLNSLAEKTVQATQRKRSSTKRSKRQKRIKRASNTVY